MPRLRQITSWIWALGLGMGLCSLVPSLILRMPVMVAWSTPGAAVLATAGLAGGFSMGEAIGAFIVSAAFIILVGVTAWFERIMNPHAYGNCLGPASRGAGQVWHAGLFGGREQSVFGAGHAAGLPAVAPHGSALRRHHDLAGWHALGCTAGADAVVCRACRAGDSGLYRPVFSLQALISLALPLFVVTMASQNLPGVAVIRATGYQFRCLASSAPRVLRPCCWHRLVAMP